MYQFYKYFFEPNLKMYDGFYNRGYTISHIITMILMLFNIIIMYVVDHATPLLYGSILLMTLFFINTGIMFKVANSKKFINKQKELDEIDNKY